MEAIHRCAACNRKCVEVLEDITLSPTRYLNVYTFSLRKLSHLTFKQNPYG